MLISKAEFARRMKVSSAAVGKACKSGRLSVIEGKWLDEKVAALQWDLNRQRLPPASRFTPTAPDPEIDWEMEATGLWITLGWNRPGIPTMARHWLELATNEPADPILLERFIALLEDFSDCVNRLENPEPELEP